MFTLERQIQILDYLKLKKTVSVEKLSKKFFIGEATIRRDLDKLEKQCLIKRTYGGAILIEGLNVETSFYSREKENFKHKDHIATLANQYVNEGDIILLDSSTTTYALTKYLMSKNDLTVITNSVQVTSSLSNSSATVYCTGGKLCENTFSLLGEHAKRFIEKFSASKLFFSCRGICAKDGITDNSDEEAVLRSTMVENADQIILLCDSTKFEKKAFSKICKLDVIDVIITDQKPPISLYHDLVNLGIEVVW